MAQDWAALIAGLATLVQIVAAVLVVLLVRRHPLPFVGPLAVVVLLLMVLRRVLATVGWPNPAPGGGFAVTQEATGLGISLAVALGIGLLWRVAASAASRETTAAPPTARADEVASAREEERELLSYDLHDGLSQLVVGSHMHLDAFKSARGQSAERAERELGLMSQCLEQAVVEVRRIMSDLSLTVSPQASLSECIGRYVGKLSQTQHWRCDLDDQLGGRRFAPGVESMAFRLVQEALNNAAKHAQTDRVRVSLCVEDGSLVAAVRDWGRGFDPGQMEPGRERLGLRGMCSRARLVGGSCVIESAPGKGTTVTSRVPCGSGEEGTA
jgi:signal transduction histidine kinase